MAERLTADVALALLCNTLATGAILFVIIVIFAPISGAHFNPAVTLVVLLNRGMRAQHAAAYVGVQIVGGLFGVFLAHAMFGETIFAWGIKPRTGTGQWLSEGWPLSDGAYHCGSKQSPIGDGGGRRRALYIVAAYWFTASNFFQTPRWTLARSLTPSFAGILPSDAPAFILAQIDGAFLAWLCGRILFPKAKGHSADKIG